MRIDEFNKELRELTFELFPSKETLHIITSTAYRMNRPYACQLQSRPTLPDIGENLRKVCSKDSDITFKLTWKYCGANRDAPVSTIKDFTGYINHITHINSALHYTFEIYSDNNCIGKLDIKSSSNTNKFFRKKSHGSIELKLTDGSHYTFSCDACSYPNVQKAASNFLQTILSSSCYRHQDDASRPIGFQRACAAPLYNNHLPPQAFYTPSFSSLRNQHSNPASGFFGGNYPQNQLEAYPNRPDSSDSPMYGQYKFR